MTLTWVVLGTIAQVMLAGFLFMVTVFAGAGLGNEASLHGRVLRTHQTVILAAALFALPGLCALSAGIVIYQYVHAASVTNYWWYALAPLAAVLYLAWAIALGRRVGAQNPPLC